MPPFSLLADSVGNESGSCRSFANQAERQLSVWRMRTLCPKQPDDIGNS